MMRTVFLRRGGPLWTPRTMEDVELEASREWRSDGEIKAQLKREPNWKKLKTLEL